MTLKTFVEFISDSKTQNKTQKTQQQQNQRCYVRKGTENNVESETDIYYTVNSTLLCENDKAYIYLWALSCFCFWTGTEMLQVTNSEY